MGIIEFLRMDRWRSVSEIRLINIGLGYTRRSSPMSNRYIVYITLTPKSPDLLGDVQQLMLSTRDMFLGLRGSLSHDVGVTDGKVHVIETYESATDAENFEKMPEHDEMIQKLLPLVTADIAVLKLSTVGASR
ncbi:hypothetical protein B0J17DRAFT_654778 [Rhizoctonia solani]|nr:hypothetical protein B0J17DRAFT_654778 [Rhizoctonia solani]